MRCSIADRVAVSRVLADDSVYVPINGEKCLKPESIANDLLLSDGAYVLMPNDGFVGIFLLLNPNIYVFHANALPYARGDIAVSAGQKAIDWMFENTDCMKILLVVPTHSPHVISYGEKVGFREVGILEKSTVKNGEPFNSIVMEI